jgi:hypothetical protein
MSNRILSYRGLLADGGQDTILLSTKKGEVGYRITKFQIFFNTPGLPTTEPVMKIYKDEQSTVDGIVDFSDNRLLAASYARDDAGTPGIEQMTTIFDQEIFNQNIYVTHDDVNTATGLPNNYYLELEVIKLDESQAMVATLKDIRNNQ